MRKDQNKENGFKKATFKLLIGLAGKINRENKCNRGRTEGKWRVPECYSRSLIYPSEKDIYN